MIDVAILPPAARSKLSSITDAAEAARALADNLKVRAAELEAVVAQDPSNAADLEGEITRLRALQSRQQQRHHQLLNLLGQLRYWLSKLGSDLVLEQARYRHVTPRENETLVAAVARIRDEIEAAKRDRRNVKNSPMSRDEVKAAARTYVRDLAALTKPKIGRTEGSFDFSNPDSFGFSAARAISLLAWLDPEKFQARLFDVIDALPEAATALPAKEKIARIDALTADIERYEKEEEALVELAAEQGIEILRRRDASPAAVLGVTVKSRKAVAA